MRKAILGMFILLWINTFAIAGVSEEDYAKYPPLKKYKIETDYKYAFCKITFNIAASKSNLGLTQDNESDFITCFEDAKKSTKLLLNKSLKTVKTASAKTALKNYHVTFLVALDGIYPGKDEIKIDYARRQQALNDKMQEAWAKFEVDH